MSLENFSWRTLSRENLSDALFGRNTPVRLSNSALLNFNLNLDSILVGYAEDSKNKSYAPPSLIILDNAAKVEIFSWLRVHAPEIFPLSQFARVLSLDDWNIYRDSSNNANKYRIYGREDRWASLIAGEIIAQGDIDIDLSKLPLSRAAGCFTTAVAKTHLNFGEGESLALCTSRLKLLASDKRFSKRHVSVEALSPIWSVIIKAGTDIYGIDEALDVIFNAISQERENSELVNIYSNAPELIGNSIEQRVIAFNRVISDLRKLPVNVCRTSSCSAIVAICAFLVGRGTSHEFLVRRNIDVFPFGTLWFGLLAGLVGSDHWDENWSRATKGVERQLRSSLRWEDSAGFDLCWAEYQWYASIFDDNTYSGIPKLVQRVLSVEVVPGASCQFRIELGMPTAPTQHVPKTAQSPTPSKDSNEMADLVAQFIKLAAKAEALMRPVESQTQLFEKPPATPRTRAKKAKGV